MAQAACTPPQFHHAQPAAPGRWLALLLSRSIATAWWPPAHMVWQHSHGARGYALLLQGGHMLPPQASHDSHRMLSCPLRAIDHAPPCGSHRHWAFATENMGQARMAWQRHAALMCRPVGPFHRHGTTDLACGFRKGSWMHLRTILGTSVREVRISAQPVNCPCSCSSPMLT
jgi:hypothetical protein